jgi:MFS family permease
MASLIEKDGEPPSSSPTAEQKVPSSDITRDAEKQFDINEKALLRKLDWKLLPPLTLLYLLSFLDRSNGKLEQQQSELDAHKLMLTTKTVGNAKLEGLTEDVKMTGDQYLTGLTLYFIGYVLFEIPCNIILKRTTPRLWLPTITLFWGIVATLLGVVHNYAGYLVSRFFLGVTESGLFPGVVFYLSMWYKRNEQHFRISLFFSAASLAGAFGGVLAWVSSCYSRVIMNIVSNLSLTGNRTHEKRWRVPGLEMDFHPCSLAPTMSTTLFNYSNECIGRLVYGFGFCHFIFSGLQLPCHRRVLDRKRT